MTILRSFKRLLHVRDIEEEQARISLEAALHRFNELQTAAQRVQQRDQEGRRMLISGIEQGDGAERIAGLEESRCAAQQSRHLKPQMEEAEASVSILRRQLMERRLARRQAETILQGADIKAHLESLRRMQQASDERFLDRREQAVHKLDETPTEVKNHRPDMPES